MTMTFPKLTCRKCPTQNPVAFLAPVVVPGDRDGTCICIPCARKRAWLDADDNLKSGVDL